MKKALSFLLFLTVLSVVVFGQSNIPTGATGPAAAMPKSATSYYYPQYSPYYHRTLAPIMPTQDTSKITIHSLVDSVYVSTQYLDPLNRPYETIVRQASPSKKDYVSIAVYDEFSRQGTVYLPFAAQSGNYNDGLFKPSPITADSSFYKSQYSNEQVYYGQEAFDASPLERVLKTTAPGNSWTGANAGISYGWRASNANDSVRLWTIAITTEDDVPATSSFYQAGALFVKQVTNERGVQAMVYMDELGRKILTKSQVASSPTTGHSGWLCTYYVYDEMNHLRMVIPPAAVEALNNSTVNWNLSSGAINYNLCYAYWYDSRGRTIMKRVPGKGKSYAAYDLFDRVVMTQDSSLRATSQWSFVLYDAQNRPDTSGLITTSIIKDSVIAQASRSIHYPAVSGTYTITSVIYYDDYNWIAASGAPVSNSLVTTNINSTNFNTSYNTAPYYAQPITASGRTRGFVTGTRNIVINSTTYLWNVSIYDDHGRAIQSKQTNYTGGTDIATAQYSFIGRVLSTHMAHQKSGNNAQTHTLLTLYTYDHVGRVLTVAKKLDNLVTKTVSTNTYNELGQLQSKAIGSNIETQNYTYNIRGWLLGINSSYVGTSGSTSNYFGETLSYDYGFTNTQLNGNLAGVSWKAGGDGIPRAYGFTYDNANRLTVADFSQQNTGSTSWTKDKVDYTVNGLTYDAGGNILSMMQKGLISGSPATVDSLNYQYYSNSNQLQKVTDGSTNSSALGDFKDTTYTGDDYAYDANGNITKDYNRHMITASNGNGAVYNYLNKPDSIVISGKAGIHYYYDAKGMQLAKTVNDYTGGVLVSKNYLYVNGFVYLNDTLQYVLQEEGQIRYAKKVNSSTGAVYYAYEYDYFIKDHLGNVRTVLTEGSDTATYAATMESKDSVVVAATFSNVYTPVNTVYPKPSTFDTDTSNHNVALLNPSTSAKVGPSIVLKVMKGDQVQLNTYAYYNSPVQSPQSGINLLTDILSVLGNGVIGSSGGKLGSPDLTNVDNALNPNITQFLNNSRSYDSTRPKAYLNWILFDDQFNYVAGNSGVQQVLAGSSKQALVAPAQTITKNGYLYVYVSNESPQNVYFDNITVKQITGPLQQEQSYYPFGLPMAGISDKALLKKNTPYKANGGTELEEDFGLEYYNTLYRRYDPQIGRFNGVDALCESSIGSTPYHFGANNPIAYVDPSGLKALPPEVTNEQQNFLNSAAHSWNDVDASFEAIDEEMGIVDNQLALLEKNSSGSWDDDDGMHYYGAAAQDAFRASIAGPPVTYYNYSNAKGTSTFETTEYHGLFANTEGDSYKFIGATVRGSVGGSGNSDGEKSGWDLAFRIDDYTVMSKDVAVNGIIGAQKLANWASNTKYAITDLGEVALAKGLTVELAGRALGGASLAYNVIKFANHPTVGRALEAVVSGVSIIPGWGWAVGALYFVADLGWQAAHDGKSIAESIDNE